jgi:ribonuclease D
VTIHLYQNDLPDGLTLGPIVAIDTETMGLDPRRDRLCLVQLSSGDGHAHLVQIARGQTSAPNLERLLTDPATEKLFHFGRFDIAALHKAFGVLTAPVWCTKVAARVKAHGFGINCNHRAQLQAIRQVVLIEVNRQGRIRSDKGVNPD